MRTIRFLIEKEFMQIFRNKSLLPILFIVPIIQLLVLPLAADYEVKGITISIVDHDHSSYSRDLTATITSSGYFKNAAYSGSYNESLLLIEKDKADIILEIPAGFEKNLVRENKDELFIAINAINGVKAGLGGAYVSRIINQFNADIRLKWTQVPTFNAEPVIEVVSSDWFNPNMNYKYFMVPGILAVLVTMISSYVCALNIVKEKEIGTIEQINVTPIRKMHFILGKLIPFLIIGMVVFSLGLFVVARFVYHIVPVGSILLLYAFLFIYLIAMLGFGLLISTYAETQQQAMSIAFFFIMIFMLMCGLFTAIESMPAWAQIIAQINPVTYFIQVLRMIILKGSGFNDLRVHFMVITIMAIGLNGWAILNYRKTT
ncbi:MAG: ABC transporter permease [Saprospiraceae bacterium]